MIVFLVPVFFFEAPIAYWSVFLCSKSSNEPNSVLVGHFFVESSVDLIFIDRVHVQQPPKVHSRKLSLYRMALRAAAPTQRA